VWEFEASVNVTFGAVPVQNVFNVVAEPTPESVVGAYVGVRFAGPSSVTVQEAVIVVDTVKVFDGMANAPAETAAKRAAPATRAVPVRARWLMFKSQPSTSCE
jgi:hypothetical protein